MSNAEHTQSLALAHPGPQPGLRLGQRLEARRHPVPTTNAPNVPGHRPGSGPGGPLAGHTLQYVASHQPRRPDRVDHP
jgi:hypothetical protein